MIWVFVRADRDGKHPADVQAPADVDAWSGQEDTVPRLPNVVDLHVRQVRESRVLYQDAGQIEDVVAAAERWCGRQAGQFADVARHIRENVLPALEDGWTNASGVSQVLGVSWTVTLSGGSAQRGCEVLI